MAGWHNSENAGTVARFAAMPGNTLIFNAGYCAGGPEGAFAWREMQRRQLPDLALIEGPMGPETYVRFDGDQWRANPADLARHRDVLTYRDCCFYLPYALEN
jgi:hypothetical protein